MRKNVLVSLLAATAPMVAFADADVSKFVSNTGAADWNLQGEEGTDFKFETGVLTSIKGAEVSQVVKNLAKGNYKLEITVTGADAVLTVNGAALPADGIVALDGTQNLEIKVTSEGEKEFTVAFKSLTLVFDFEAANKNLTNRLSEVGAMIKTLDDAEAQKAELLDKVSVIAAKIKEIVDGNYDAYVKYELYNDWSESPLIDGDGGIDALESEYNAMASNSDAYYAAKPVIAAWTTTDLAAYKADFDGRTDYAKTKYQAAFDEISTAIANATQALEDAYKAGTAGVDFTTEKINAKWEEIEALWTALEKNLTIADQDDADYNTVVANAAAAKTTYSDKVQEIVQAIAGEVYEDTRKQIMSALADELVKANEAAALVGDAENHDQATENVADANAAIAAAVAAMEQIVTDAIANHTTLTTAYNTAIADVQALDKDFADAEAYIENVKDSFANDTVAIRAAITELKEAIESNNKAHEIDDYVASAGYTDAKAAIAAAIAKLEADAVAPLANYAANEAVLAEIEKLQDALDKAKEGVAKLKSADEKYAAAGKYTATEKALQEAIDKLEAELAAAYKAGTAVDYQTESAADITAVKADIDAYANDAQDALDAYEAITAALKGYNDNYAALAKVVTNGAVKTATGETYAAALADIKSRIEDIQNAFDKALALTDEEHVDGMTGVETDLDASIDTDIDALEASYDADKKAYDDQVATDAVTAVLAEVEKQVKNVEDNIKLATDNWTKEELGLSFERIVNDSLVKINTALAAEKAKADISKYSLPEQADEALAVLTEVKAALDKIKNDYNVLAIEVDAIMKAVDANAAQYAVAQSRFTELRDLIRGTKTVTGIVKLSVDPNKTTDFQTLADNLFNELKAIRTKYNKSNNKETLVEDWADAYDADGALVTKGYETLLNELAVEVEEARALAVRIADNYNAYVAVDEAYADADFATLITTAETDVKAVAEAEGETFFLGVVAGYAAEYPAIQAAYENDYTDTLSVENQKARVDAIDALVANINGVAGLAEANQKAYEAQDSTSADLQKQWETLFNEVASTDESSMRDTRLSMLTEAQITLNAANDNISALFAKGESDVKNAEVEKVLNDIKNVINTVKAMGDEENYNAQINADNIARDSAFTAEIQKAEQAYKAAVELLGQYANMKNTEYAAEIAVIIETHKEIYSQAALITALKAEEAEALQKAFDNPGSVFDADEEFKDRAIDIRLFIETKLQEFVDAVTVKAESFRATAEAEIETKLNAAIAELVDYDTEIIEGAFSEARALLETFKALASADNLALELDKYLGDYDNIDDIIESDKEPTAEKEWNKIYEAAEKTYDDTLEVINGMTSADGVDYAAEYTKVWDKTIVKALALIEEKGEYLSIMTELHAYISQFNTEAAAVFTAAENASKNHADNVNAYDEAIKLTVELEAQYVEAYNFVMSFCFAEGNSITELERIEGQIAQLIKNIKEDLEKGLCSTNAANYESNVAILKADIVALYQKAIYEEYITLSTTQLNAVRVAYNKAFAEVVGDETKQAEVEKYNDLINDIEKAIFAAYDLDQYKDKDGVIDWNLALEKFLSIEVTMAEYQTVLTEYYEAAASETLYKSVSIELTGYLEQLQLCIGNVNKYDDLKEKYAAEFTEWEGTINLLIAQIEEYYASKTILFYEKKITTLVQQIVAENSEISVLIKNFETIYEKYEVNENRYFELSAELTTLEERAAEIATTIGNYDNFKGWTAEELEERDSNYRYLIDRLNKAKSDLQSRYENKKLSATSDILQKSYIEDKVKYVEKYFAQREYGSVFYSYDDAQGNRVTLHGKLYAIMYTQAYNAYSNLFNDNSEYAPGVKDQVLAELYEIYNTEYENARRFERNAFYGSISNNINGVDVREEVVNADGSVGYRWKKIDYMSEALVQIITKIKEVQTRLAKLEALLAESKYVTGDIDGDGEVRVNDYERLLRIVLGKDVTPEKGTIEFLVADANSDDAVNVGDIQEVVNILINKASSSPAPAPAREAYGKGNNAMNMSFVDDGGNHYIIVKLTNSRDFVAGQFDIKLPAGMMILSENVTDRAEGLDLYSNDLGNGIHRVVLSSLAGSEIEQGDNGAIVCLQVAGNVKPAEVSVANAIFADAMANTYSIGGANGDGTTGINGVEAEVKSDSKVYSLGGKLMNFVKKGVNIIRNNDGSTKKVIK